MPGGSGKVVLHPTSFDATHLDLAYQIGPGATLDTDKYAVVVPNLLGSSFCFILLLFLSFFLFFSERKREKRKRERERERGGWSVAFS